ncbi:MAG TPA: BON domain-containing protein [Pirellulaceae bacterium]|nr:BON domain-containing protein [Pirellulaceae bacterium]
MYSAAATVCVAILLAGQAAPKAEKDPVKQPAAADAAVSPLPSLALQVESALVSDRVTGDLPIKVKVEDKVVAVEGTVPTEAARNRVSQVASRATGKNSALVAIRVRVQEDLAKAKEKTVADPVESAKPTALDKAQVERLRALIKKNLPEAAERIHLVFRVDPMPTIVLEGALDTYDQKLAISKLVRENYKGLAILNNVRVHQKPATATGERPAKVGKTRVETTSDSAITVDEDTPPADRPLAEKVADALRKEKRIADAAIVVQADGDVIWLRGSVQSNQQRVLAVNVAGTVPKVDYVIDDLTVNAVPNQAETAEPLAVGEVATYVRTYLSRRVGVEPVEVKAQGDVIRVVLAEKSLDADERKALAATVKAMEKELGRKIELDASP